MYIHRLLPLLPPHTAHNPHPQVQLCISQRTVPFPDRLTGELTKTHPGTAKIPPPTGEVTQGATIAAHPHPSTPTHPDVLTSTSGAPTRHANDVDRRNLRRTSFCLERQLATSMQSTARPLPLPLPAAWPSPCSSNTFVVQAYFFSRSRTCVKQGEERRKNQPTARKTKAQRWGGERVLMRRKLLYIEARTYVHYYRCRAPDTKKGR